MVFFATKFSAPKVCGGKLSFIRWKIVVYTVENCRLYTACIVYCIVHVYSARNIAHATIVTLRKTAKEFSFQFHRALTCILCRFVWFNKIAKLCDAITSAVIGVFRQFKKFCNLHEE